MNIPARRDGQVIARTRLARAAFVDFFPSVDRFAFRPIDDRFVLLGTGTFQGSSGPFLLVALSQRAPSTEAVVLTARASGVAGTPVQFFGKRPELGVRFSPGEPLVVRLPLPAGARGGRAIDFSIASAGKTLVVPVGNVSSEALGPPPSPLPFPNNLPGTSDPELMELGARLRALVAARRERGDRTLSEPLLGRKLADSAERAEKAGAPLDAYLALVWAVQADPELLRTTYRRIAALRPDRRRAPYLEEQPLLAAFYASHDPLVQLELVYFYALQELWDKARYFAERLPEVRPGTTAEVWARELSHARRVVRARIAVDPEPSAVRAVSLPGVASDFEGEPLGWTRDGAAFDVVKDDEGATPVWGVDGQHYFSSGNAAGGGGAATGHAESPAFVVDGRLLGFLVAGDASAKLSVELVVEGEPVLRATGSHSSHYFFPVLWDLRPFRGKRARLRLSDTDPRGFISVDHLRIWPELASTALAAGLR